MGVTETDTKLEERGISLPQVLDITNAEALRQEFLEAFEAGYAVRVNAAFVSQVSTPCVQVLLSAAKTFGEASRGFSLAEPSEPLTDAFRHLGLSLTALNRSLQE